MDLKLRLKYLAEDIPYSLGKWTSYIPYKYRLGNQYTDFSKLAYHYEHAGPEKRYTYIIERLNRIVQYAQKNIPFYKILYGPKPIMINNLEDFERLPIITKSQVREYVRQSTGAMLINTGGTSGEPLSFYLDRSVWAREWAHMHYIWGLRGYKHTDLMITMLGKDLGDKLFKYNAVHNEIKINPYKNAGTRISEVKKIFNKYPVKFFQGYPSSIYNFFRELENELDDIDKELITSKIKSCFFSSEYPIPYMVNYLRDVWSLKYISWYGHSEMCILAYDNECNGRYKPFVTYGYAEDVDGVLCGTSFHNFDMPLIRYATGDLIDSQKNNYGIMDYFKIKEGREGDFIEDRFGRKIPLTALIFGRHHEIFNIADYVQISQLRKGVATLYISFKKDIPIKPEKVLNYFNLKNVNIDFDYVILKEPVYSKNGKFKLKLSENDIQRHIGSFKEI
jgi:phenylacetate-CoA ligase